MARTVLLAVGVVLAALAGEAGAQERTQITVQTAKVKQDFDGLGAGAIFYEGHITSLDARNKKERQEQLYDDMFKHVPTRYLQLMIRETHEPKMTTTTPTPRRSTRRTSSTASTPSRSPRRL